MHEGFFRNKRISEMLTLEMSLQFTSFSGNAWLDFH